MNTGELIAKEQIANYHMTHAAQNRTIDLYYKLVGAQRLGNEFKGKVSITFQTLEGPKKVETTVWSVTDQFIQLKNGVHIPLNSLLDISY